MHVRNKHALPLGSGCIPAERLDNQGRKVSTHAVQVLSKYPLWETASLTVVCVPCITALGRCGKRNAICWPKTLHREALQ